MSSKRNSVISHKTLSLFLADLYSSLRKSGLESARNVMKKYNIEYNSKTTQSRYVLDAIISELLEPDDMIGKRRHSNLTVNTIELVKEFLNNGVNARDCDNYNSNMLSAAFKSLIPEYYEILLNHGADPNLIDKYGESPLSMVLDGLLMNNNPNSNEYKSMMSIMTILLNSGADPWQRLTAEYLNNTSATFIIMSLSDLACVDIRQRLNPILYKIYQKRRSAEHNKENRLYDNITDNYVSQDEAIDAVYSIREYVFAGKISETLDILQRDFDISFQTKVLGFGQYFFSLLFGEMNELISQGFIIEFNNYMSLITQFLEHGVDVNFMGDNNEDNLLCSAVYNRNPDLCELLLRYGADPNIVPSVGRGPVEAAIFSLNFDVNQNNNLPECISVFLKRKVIIDKIERFTLPTRVKGILNTIAYNKLITLFRRYGYISK